MWAETWEIWLKAQAKCLLDYYSDYMCVAKETKIMNVSYFIEFIGMTMMTKSIGFRGTIL